VHYGLDWDWASAIVFGVLIAATDPVSVIATFKEAKVPFVANSLIFLLIGAQEAQQHFKDLWAPVVAAIVLVMVGRAIAIYPLCGLFAGSSEQKSLLNQCVAMPHPEISREYGGLSTSITFGTEIKGRPCRA
jgi:NhaP-type Na+/H+ or K+/H+ antiporter